MNAFILSENRFDPKNIRKNESIMCRGNGYMCVRASLEEKYIGEQRNTLINGVFNAPPGEVSEIAVLPDATNCEIEIGGERFDMIRTDIQEYSRILDMKAGEGVRSLVWKSNSGRIRLEFKSIVSLTKKHITALKISITPLDQDTEIKIRAGIDAKVTNTGVQHFSAPVRRVYEDGILGLYLKTLQSGVDVSVHCRCSCDKPYKEEYTTDRRSVYSCISLSVKQGETAIFQKLTSYATSRDVEYAETDVCPETVNRDGTEYLKQALLCGYDALYAESAEMWKKYWEQSPLEICGSDFENKAISFAKYHLNVMASKDDNRVGIGAKGLSGEGYKGHSFWDTEIFILPYYIYTEPETARRLLEYRYKLLDSALLKAKRYGFEGAMYPWEGAWLTDGETCPEEGDLDLMTGEVRKNMMGEIEVHISADIAYAVWQYFQATGDEDFMQHCGYEMILLTAYFWSSRIAEKNGRYEILGVIGPDEYKDNIDNNAYTNYMAFYNLKLAEKIMDKIPEHLRKKYDTQKMLCRITETAERLYLPKADKDGIIPAFDGYRDLEETDTSKYKNRDKVGLIFKDYGFDEIQKLQVGKQADTIMLFHLLGDMFSDEEIKRNYEFYEQRTLHDSSLSMCFHALVGAKCALADEAAAMYHRACSVDIGENVNNSDEGIHSASIGGIWLALAMGFGGLCVEDGMLSVSPILPKGWSGYRFTVCFCGTRLLIETDSSGSQVKRLCGEEKEIRLSGKKLVV
ncbi:MAG: glycoside hydrolase family 65 protein [Clostridia bacterium]|nr:glycoside hydrolase family 65 protein [Clostridia bacterium]